MTRRARVGVAALWLAALVVLAFVVQRALVVGNDLRSFMPPAQTADQKLLLDEIGDGPASRLLLLAISAADARASRRTEPRARGGAARRRAFQRRC